MTVKVHRLDMGDSIKTDEIKAEMVNPIKRNNDNNIISNSNSKPS